MSKYQSSTKYEIRQNIRPRIAPLTAAVSGAIAAGSLQAATITVDTLNDGLNSGECTLRSALYAATRNSTSNDCSAGDVGADTIVFASGLSGTIALGTGGLYYDGSTLPIGESVTIDGDNEITIQGTGDAPVFYAKYDDTAAYNADIVQIAQVTITGGGGDRGGGILSRANSLQLSDVTIDSNVATEAGAGVWHEPYNGEGELLMLLTEVTGNTVTGADGYGGGVGVSMLTGSDIQIASSTFYGNSVISGGGGGLHLQVNDYAYVDIKYSTFENNSAKYGNGGGMQADLRYAIVDLTDNTFTGNEAYYSGGGLYLKEDGAAFQRAEISLDENNFTHNRAGSSGGGASINVLYGSDGTLAEPVKFVDFSGLNIFDDNEAGSGGGALFLNLDDTISGSLEGASFAGNVNDVGGGGALLAQVQASEITMQNVAFFANETYSGDGGAVLADVTDGALYGSEVAMSQNSATSGAGGGLQVTANNSDFGLEYSEFVGNQADGCGGGLRLTGTPLEVGLGHSNMYYNSASCGGAMSLFAPSAQNVLVEVKYNSMVENYATSSGTTGGGAIFADFGSGSQIFVKNSTISGNDSANIGGGIRLRGDMTGEIKYSTIANNYTYQDGGGIYNSLTGCNINNSILAGNTNETGLYQDLRGTEDCTVSNTALAGAKYSDYVDGGNNILNTDPLIEPLANNGGNAGFTHALQPASPAIDAGDAGDFAPDYDQRGPGFARIQGGALDMGAFEAGPEIDEIFSDRFEQP
ncbi:choice-of-anchor Q domain-containing protein [Wenzhouxiangella sediminis]|uniref:CSLREA domain-containing protein n=1 Tax=Wenzhouxiangella sediminis TaxID=1792836 RepID=A0A3E1KAU7_9GAMM|nr:choice-of-anchor Q domain-containing protein [Wenzhouxiangella sediminis]RFF31355.1 hypothetical protein DZC52_04650 [Wenzhouxiangella sediminis]